MNHSLIPNDEEIVCKLKDATGIRDLTQKEFKERLGSTFTIAPLFSKQALRHAGACFENLTESQKTVIDSVALYNQGEPAGHGIVALRDIRKGEIICGFGGKVIPMDDWNNEIHSHRAKLYCTAGGRLIFDPSTYASLGSFVNDGPPNSELKTLSDPKVYANTVQVPLEKVIAAVRDIKAGEPIYHDYGWDHGIKQAPYALDEEAAAYLLQKFGNNLDINLLNKTGWIFTALDQRISDTSDLVRATELEYILTTPYVLALLHLKTNLHPSETLTRVRKLPIKIQNEFKEWLDNASMILMGLAKINIDTKEEFLKVADKISQQSLVSLCQLLTELQSQPSMEDCLTFGRALDNLRLLCCGSLIVSYWTSTEREEFQKLFLSKEHQKTIHDDTAIQSLPIEFKNSYYIKKNQFIKFARQQQMDIK